jgi:hypothetical protein
VAQLFSLYEFENMTRKRQESALRVVANTINEWDPYGLIGGGAPNDEFDGEVRGVVRQLDRIHSAEDAAHVVSRVFSSSFEAERFDLDACRPVGKKLYLALKDGGLLD